MTPQLFNRVKPTLEKAGSLVGNERGGILMTPIDIRQALKNFFFGHTEGQPQGIPANPLRGSADGLHLKADLSETSRSPSTSPNREFYRWTDYSEPMLINRGAHGADAVFKQSLESRVTPDLTNGGQKLVQYMAENKIDTINGRQLAPNELNTLASEVSKKIMTSSERANSFVKDGNGSKLIEVWANDFDGGMLFTKTGEFVEFVGRIPAGKETAHLQPPARASPIDLVSDQKLGASRITPGWLPNLSDMKKDGFKWQFDAMNSGSLPADTAKKFFAGRYNEGVVPQGEHLVVYKAGDANKPGGSFGTFETPVSEMLTRIDSAVKQFWIDPETGGLTGTSYLNSSMHTVLGPGEKFYYGPTSYQGGSFAGGSDRIQIYLPRKEPKRNFTVDGPIP